MSELTISIRDLKALVEPVMPFAARDDGLPTINTVYIESRGSHLLAFATDRFRLGCQRLAAAEDGRWPEWSANIPVATLRSIFQTYKPKRFAEPMVTLKIDGDALTVHGDDALVDLLDASVTYPLAGGAFPKVRNILREAIASEERGGEVGVNPAFLADFARGRSGGPLAMRVGGEKSPILFADGDDFVAVLMPRRLVGGEGSTFPSLSSWDDLFADAAEPAPKKRTRKSKGAAA
jgi:DNA polymerase III sliding clamp (beta) subunit (PCNA family)